MHVQLPWEIWLAAAITLGIYSVLYKDNKLYRVLLNILIGLNVGYTFMITWYTFLKPNWWDKITAGYRAIANHQPGGGQILWILVGVLGVFWYFQLSKKHMWLSRIVIGMTLGAGAGAVFKGQFLLNAPQITDSFRPLVCTLPGKLWTHGETAMTAGLNHSSLFQSINNIVFVLTIVCVMIYFFFSFSHEKKFVGSSAKLGRWLLMITFGAFFGNTVMTRMAVFLERLQYLINDWGMKAIPNTPPLWYAIGGVAVLVLLSIYFLTRKPPVKPGSPDGFDEEESRIAQAELS